MTASFDEPKEGFLSYFMQIRFSVGLSCDFGLCKFPGKLIFNEFFSHNMNHIQTRSSSERSDAFVQELDRQTFACSCSRFEMMIKF